MVERRRINRYRTLVLGLLGMLLLGATPALAQDEDERMTARLDSMQAQMMRTLYPLRANDDFRVSAWVGTCFHTRQASEHCHRVQADVRFMFKPPRDPQQPRTGARGFAAAPSAYLRADYPPGAVGVGLQGSATYGDDDHWPDPDPPPIPPPTNAPKSSQEETRQVSADHDGTLATTVDLLLVVPLQRKFLLEPFLGIGVTQIFEGSDLSATSVAIEGKTMIPTVAYGASLAVRVSPRVDLRFQFRGAAYRVGTLTYLIRDGRRIEREVGTISTSSLFVGFGFRIPR